MARRYLIRKAKLTDVKDIQRLVNFYAKKNEMLPLSLSELYDNIRAFFVCESKGKILGCGALHVSWEFLGEIRSLAVQRSAQRRGIGAAIVRECLKEATCLELEKVFVLTYRPSFFESLGFHRIDKFTLPHKVWRECIKCVHFPDCTEDALIMSV